MLDLENLSRIMLGEIPKNGIRGLLWVDEYVFVCVYTYIYLYIYSMCVCLNPSVCAFGHEFVKG